MGVVIQGVIKGGAFLWWAVLSVALFVAGGLAANALASESSLSRTQQKAGSNCPNNLRLDAPDTPCLSDLGFMKRHNSLWKRSNLDVIANNFSYYVFLPEENRCEAVGVGGVVPAMGGSGAPVAARIRSEAKANCESSGCECALAIESGKVVNQALVTAHAARGASPSLAATPAQPGRPIQQSAAPLISASDLPTNSSSSETARNREQEKFAREAIETETGRLARETLEREQRLTAEAAERQRVAQAAAREEQENLAREAAAKERERIVQELALKERQRLAAEELARAQQLENQRLASELAKLRAEQSARQTPRQEVMTYRKALVIGIDSYRFVLPLRNAREDARAIAENLASVGYSVTLKLDVPEREMKATLRAFKNQIERGDEVAFFFAGHGVQIGTANYLIPADIHGESEDQIRDEGVSLQRVLDDFSEKWPKFTLALIDACRDNPFKAAGRSIGSASRGLSPTTAATGQMIIFSAGAGQRALDSLGDSDKSKNGVFTRVFIREMQKASVTIDRVIRETRTEVVRLAKSIGHDQVPAIYDQVVGDFYFRK